MRGKIDDKTREYIIQRDKERFKPIKIKNSTETFANKIQPVNPKSEVDIPQINAPEVDIPQINAPEVDIPQINYPQSNDSNMTITDSYLKMIGGGNKNSGIAFPANQGMGDLESASMRLANAASQRQMLESANEYGLRGQLAGVESGYRQKEMGTEYGLRGQLAGTESGYRQKEMGTEYGLRGQLAGTESGYRQKEMGTESGYRQKEMGVASKYRQKEMGTEYGLRGQLARGEADILAQQSGYSGLSGMQSDIARRRFR